MQITAGIALPLQDEHVVATDPTLAPQVPGIWRKRYRAFTGRALTADALTAEQDARAGKTMLRGQSVSSGVVRGTDVQVEAGTAGLVDGQAILHVSSGFGLARSGEDVSVQTPRRLRIADLPAMVRADWLDSLATGAPPPSAIPAGFGAPDAAASPSGAFAVLPPPLPRRMAPRFGDLFHTVIDPFLPRAAILVAEPVVAELSGRSDPADPCPRDPRDDPYNDWQRIDGCRLTLYPWPSEMVSTPVNGERAPDYALPGAGDDFRNQLAWRIFGAEQGFLTGEAHPWEMLGVPLALLGFASDWSLLFADRSAVARTGGMPAPRTPALRQSGTAFLFQARLLQFVEHLADLGLDSVTPDQLTSAMRQMPPVGVLPMAMLDPTTRRQTLFPPGFNVHAVPIAAENLELAVRESASLAPYSLTDPDSVELLVPVPERVYEPELLELAVVDPIFARSVGRFVTERTQWLIRREIVRRRRAVLTVALGGVLPGWRLADPDETQNERLPDPAHRPPVSATTLTRSVTSAGPRSLRFAGANAQLAIAAGDSLFAWTRTDPGAVPTTLAIEIGVHSDPSGGGDWTRGVFWGTGANLPGFTGNSATGQRRAGDLPTPGLWTRLTWPAASPWTPNGDPLSGIVLNGVGFVQAGGTVQWGPFGRIDAAGNETIYVADEALEGAALIPGEGPAPVTVPTDPADVQLNEDDFGTTVANADRNAAALADFRGRWNMGFLADDLADLADSGLDGFAVTVNARLRTTNDALDLGFTRARADIYRVRQYMLGADAASRLVTSPTLADIAARDDGARATSDQIRDFVTQSFVESPFRDPNNPTRPVPPPPAGTAPPPPPPPVSPLLRGGLRGVLPSGAFHAASAFTSTATIQSGRFTQATAATRIGGVGTVLDGGSLPIITVVQPGTQQLATTTALTTSLAGLFQTGVQRNVGNIDVQAQLPLIGYAERSASVGERLTIPPALEAYQYALDGKQTVFASLTRLITAPPTAGPSQTARRPGLALGDLPLSGYHFSGDGAPAGVNTLADFAINPRHYIDENALTGDATQRHESDYFAAAVTAIDSAIAMMRLVEGRVDLYNRMLTDAQSVRADIAGRIGDTDSRLNEIEGQLAEARHDVATASALLAEETQRIAEVNARRAAVLQQYATFLAFRRPRTVDRDTFAPISPADAALTEDPVASCTHQHPSVPQELREMAGLFREAPIRWLPPIWVNLKRLDTSEQVLRVYQTVQRRTPSVVSLLQQNAKVAVTGGTKYLAAATNVMTAQRQQLADYRATGLQLNLGAFSALNLTAAREQLLDAASIGDLLDGWHGRSDLVRQSANEIDSIAQVAACLYASFGEVLPAIRLTWAEQLSALTAPVALQSLAALPRWNELPNELRREQQGLTDFLFSRINPANASAVAAMNDLVRVAVLMASHAPVDRILGAALVRPTPARIGGLLDLTVDTTQVRLGMSVLVRDASDAVLAQAVVDDLGNGVARARILQAADLSVTIGADARIHLTHALPAGVQAMAFT